MKHLELCLDDSFWYMLWSRSWGLLFPPYGYPIVISFVEKTIIFLIEFTWCFGWKLVDHIWRGLFLNLLFHSTELPFLLIQYYTHNQWNRIENPEIKPHAYGQIIFDKGTKNIQWRKESSSIDGAGKIGKPHAKEWN